MPVDGFTFKSRIRNLLRSPSARKARRDNIIDKVTLEKVLGITTLGNSGLTCDPKTGLVAYPAGCVLVLLNPRKNRQQHLINTSGKTITALSFSPDGKHLVTGESGHLPAVRLWDVAERRQVAELQKHKYGVSCVTFSPDCKYIISVGNQHDMMVNVWAWKKDVVVAANKVSSKVTGVSFSEDSSYFVTVGNRHVKFWYLDHCKATKASAPVPLLGRSGLLGELRNNNFCHVACGRGQKWDSTFCITSSGLLCEFNGKRMLDKWVDLRTSMAQSLSLSEDRIFCACADGTVRAFSLFDLRFVCTLPRPHPLGTDIASITKASQLLCTKTDARYPDAIAVTYDSVNFWLSCVYDDHSLYVWDVRDFNSVGKVHSALFHAACVWDLEMFPDVPGETAAGLSPAAFLSCSSDNTIRLWNVEDRAQVHSSNILSKVSFTSLQKIAHANEEVLTCLCMQDLLKIIYTGGSTVALHDPEITTNVSLGKAAESRTGIRTICVSPDGKHLASGDRNGMLRVHTLSSMEEILQVQAHDAEILCLEYSKPETGLQLLATASRDRLIHVLDAAADYSLVQTLDEHSSSITAVRFAANDSKVRLISCGADKSIYFRTAHMSDKGAAFRPSHHTVRKSTLYDLGVDPTCKYAAVGCQDRCIRIFNISSGKQRKLYKGSLSEDGSLLRVQIDPSGQYVAASCSNKNISIFDFYSGECVATMFGHSEIVTGMRFTNDCKHLISVSGDSCILVWRLASEMTISMRERLFQLRQGANTHKSATLRREAYSAPALVGLSSDEDGGHNEDSNRQEENSAMNTSSDSSHGEEDTGGSDEGPDWGLTKPVVTTPSTSRRPRRRWSRRMGSLELMVKSMLDLRQLETFAPSKPADSHARNGDRHSTSSLREPTQHLEERAKRRPGRCRDWTKMDGTDENRDEGETGPQDIMVRDPPCKKVLSKSQDSYSPDSACSLGYDSRGTSPDGVLDDSADAASLSLDSSDDDEEMEDGTDEDEEAEKAETTGVDEALKTVTSELDSREDFLKQNFETLADGCSIAEPIRVPRLSMSSRFLARGHHSSGDPLLAKVQGKAPSSPSSKPPVSKVRPLMEEGVSRNLEDKTPVSPSTTHGPNLSRGATAVSAPIPRPQKKTTSASHLWRLSTPPSTPPLLLDGAMSLQKSQSVQNLTLTSPRSPLPSSDRIEVCKRPQHLLLDRDAPKPSYLSSPSPGSPQSPRSPHSYMNPTASSLAKSSRSSSLGEGLHAALPLSFSLSSRRSLSGDLEAESPALACLQPTATVLPTRIPQPKQPLGPRRSLCSDLKAGTKTSCLAVEPACDVTSSPGRTKAAPDDKKTVFVSRSNQDAGFGPEELPLAVEHLCAPPPDSQPGVPFVPNLSLPSPPLCLHRHSLAPRRPPLAARPVCQSACVSPVSPPCVAPPPCWQCHGGESITLETCKQAVGDLHSSLRRTITLYTAVLQRHPQAAGEGLQEMEKILSEALASVKAELDPLSRSTTGSEVKGEALALLEQYAELLLKSVERKLDGKM
ncbi:mitogen-activated protein kinase-binding protein 1-like isoform X2 [Dunckerocampus dactyliophorus]|uniref:mitogen-activated protein kinase-binding protein 1-like isoform X2 n=1 Tax=Dunckerocampus dactyliophorus TaxID=161453 RepID=UPI0024065C62|nr:mitogen-activated protein kinase-binding protein 1-like isoform X2 [Dunckerocampus dactyliophorus]